MNKKNIFNIMCKKVGMRRTTINLTTLKSVRHIQNYEPLDNSLYGHLTTWQGKPPSTTKAFSLDSRVKATARVKKKWVVQSSCLT